MVEVPAGIAGGPVVVITQRGRSDLKGVPPIFLVKPVISSFTPQTSCQNTMVTVHGSRLDLVAEVEIQGTNPLQPTRPQLVDDSTLTFSTNWNMYGMYVASGPIYVRARGLVDGPVPARSESRTSFVPINMPYPRSVLPAKGYAGQPVTISGWGFTGTTGVQLGGVDAAFTLIDDKHISAVVPVGAATGAISVITDCGNSTWPFSLAPGTPQKQILQFTVTPVPPDARPAPPAGAPAIPACEGACFSARIGSAIAKGTAVAGIDPDGNVGLSLIAAAPEDGHSITISRHGEAARIRAGVTYPVGNSCDGEAPAGSFSVKYERVRKEPAFEMTEFVSHDGTLTIDRIGEGSITGRFDFTTCTKTRDRVTAGPRVTGTFRALWFGQ